ncbi:hypothetical protein CR513_12003, partial [Mucuna pruriens]
MELALSSFIGIKPHRHLRPSIPFILWRKGVTVKDYLYFVSYLLYLTWIHCQFLSTLKPSSKKKVIIRSKQHIDIFYQLKELIAVKLQSFNILLLKRTSSKFHNTISLPRPDYSLVFFDSFFLDPCLLKSMMSYLFTLIAKTTQLRHSNSRYLSKENICGVMLMATLLLLTNKDHDNIAHAK